MIIIINFSGTFHSCVIMIRVKLWVFIRTNRGVNSEPSEALVPTGRLSSAGRCVSFDWSNMIDVHKIQFYRQIDILRDTYQFKTIFLFISLYFDIFTCWMDWKLNGFSKFRVLQWRWWGIFCFLENFCFLEQLKTIYYGEQSFAKLFPQIIQKSSHGMKLKGNFSI